VNNEDNSGQRKYIPRKYTLAKPATTRSQYTRLEQLEEFKTWMEERGLKVASTRIDKYVKAYRKLETLIESAGPPPYNGQFDKYVFLLREVDDLCWIYKGLKYAEPPGVLQVLEKTLGGAELSRDDSATAAARNFQLELRITSYFLQARYEVDLSQQSDITVQLPEGTLYVECKRLSSSKKVKQRSQEALTQLRHRFLTNKRRSNCFGLAVFDVGKILHPNQGIGET
jgi:hypothetical protein